MVIQGRKLVERLAADCVAFAPRPTEVPPIPPKSASAMDFQNKRLKGKLWFYHGIMDQGLEDDDQLDFL